MMLWSLFKCHQNVGLCQLPIEIIPEDGVPRAIDRQRCEGGAAGRIDPLDADSAPPFRRTQEVRQFDHLNDRPAIIFAGIGEVMVSDGCHR